VVTTPPAAASVPPPPATPITELPQPKAASAEASAAYVAGIQGMRDASLVSSVASLSRAVTLDPSLGPAHMRLAALHGAQGSFVTARTHHHKAQQLRSHLSPRDQAMLDAVEPLVVREDRAEAEKRMSETERRFPGDAEISFWVGRYRQILGRRTEAREAFDRALDADPKFAMVHWALGIDGEDAGDFEAAVAAYDRCLEVSPGAASCLRSRAAIRAQKGECGLLEADARRMIAIEPSGHRAYEFLARALCARGRPLETVKEAMAQEWALFPEDGRKRRELEGRTRLALLGGDFTEAESHARELEKLATGTPTEAAHAWPARVLVDVYTESGDTAKAGKAAKSFLDRREAWLPMRPVGDDVSSSVPSILAAARRAKLIDDGAFRAQRDAWLAQARGGISPLWENELWYVAFAAPAETKEEAIVAMDTLNGFTPLPAARDLNAFDFAAGKAFHLAGRTDEALVRLRSAVKSCILLDDPIAQTRAHEVMGRVLEEKGDKAGACEAYAAVTSRWAAARPRSITAERAKARSAALGCAR
jgi:serine/threonine-protein kinase